MAKMNPNELTAAYALQARNICQNLDHMTYAVGADGSDDGGGFGSDWASQAGITQSTPIGQAASDGGGPSLSDIGQGIQQGVQVVQQGAQAVQAVQKGISGQQQPQHPSHGFTQNMLYVDGRSHPDAKTVAARAGLNGTVFWKPAGSGRDVKWSAATGKWSSDGKYFIPDTFDPKMANAIFSGVQTRAKGTAQAAQKLQALIVQLGVKYGVQHQ